MRCLNNQVKNVCILVLNNKTKVNDVSGKVSLKGKENCQIPHSAVLAESRQDVCPSACNSALFYSHWVRLTPVCIITQYMYNAMCTKFAQCFIQMPFEIRLKVPLVKQNQMFLVRFHSFHQSSSAFWRRDGSAEDHNFLLMLLCMCVCACMCVCVNYDLGCMCEKGEGSVRGAREDCEVWGVSSWAT